MSEIYGSFVPTCITLTPARHGHKSVNHNIEFRKNKHIILTHHPNCSNNNHSWSSTQSKQSRFHKKLNPISISSDRVKWQVIFPTLLISWFRFSSKMWWILVWIVFMFSGEIKITGKRGSNQSKTSKWLAQNPSKRWAELFFLLYTPFWLTLCLGIVVPFKLYEVFLFTSLSPFPTFL